MFTVEATDEFVAWYEALSGHDQDEVNAAVEVLEQRGPGLGRPLVDRIVSSRHSNMKERRIGSIRILFAFDPRQIAILLVGGDKREVWGSWYASMVPKADDLYDTYLDELRQEKLL
jgi:hypothetical protein